jgi:hypothetical protein
MLKKHHLDMELRMEQQLKDLDMHMEQQWKDMAVMHEKSVQSVINQAHSLCTMYFQAWEGL